MSKPTPRTDEAMNPKNYGAYTNGEGGVTALECAFEQVVECCRLLERELAIANRELESCGQVFQNIAKAALAPERTVAGQEPKNVYQEMVAGNHTIGIVKDGKLIATDSEVYMPPASPLLPGLEPVAYIVYFGEDYRLYRDRCDAEYGINCYSRAGHITSMHPLYALSNAEISRLKGEGSGS